MGEPRKDREDEAERRIATLLRLAGEPTEGLGEPAARVYGVVHAQWRAATARRAARRRWTFAAAAAVLVAATTLTVLATRRLDAPASGPVAFVQTVFDRGLLSFDPLDSRAAAVPVSGAPLQSGTRLETTETGRAAIRLAGGPTVRLDAGTELRVVSSTTLALVRGAVYVDSGAVGQRSGPALTIETPLGDVSDVGTQFEVRLSDSAVAVRVREGRVQLAHLGRSHEAEAGAEMVVDAAGRVSRSTVQADGPEWDWTLAMAQPLDLQGRTLAEFLEWVRRESGRQIVFAEPGLEASASSVLLSGSIDGLTPEEALAAVLPTCGLTHRIDGGRLTVMSAGSAAVPDGN